MSNEDRIREIAQRGQVSPESLTDDEIREVAMAVLSDLQGGDVLKGEVGNQN